MCVFHTVPLGEVGDWRNHFSQVQSEQMDVAFKTHLEGTKLGARLKYDMYCKWWEKQGGSEGVCKRQEGLQRTGEAHIQETATEERLFTLNEEESE